MKPFTTIFLLAGVCSITLAWYPTEMTHRDSELLQQREAVRANYEKRKKDAVRHAKEVNEYYQEEQKTPPWRVNELHAPTTASRKTQTTSSPKTTPQTSIQHEKTPKRNLLPIATILLLGGIVLWVRHATKPDLIHP